MERNVASQEVRLFAFDYSTGAPKTGLTNLTAYVAKGTGAPTQITAASGVMTEIDATNAPGAYKIALTQGETDATDLMFTAKSATSNVACVPRFVATTPSNYSLLAIDGTNYAVKIQGGTGTGQVNLSSGNVGIQAGTSTGQLDFTSGIVKSNLAQILGTALTETAGQIAAAFKQFFDVATPTGTMKAITAVATVTTLTNLPAITANWLTAAGTAADFGVEVADAILDRDMATGTDSSTTSGATGRTVRSALRVLRNKLSLVAGKSYKEDDSTTNFDLTVTTDGAAVPITVVDPA